MTEIVTECGGVRLDPFASFDPLDLVSCLGLRDRSSRRLVADLYRNPAGTDLAALVAALQARGLMSRAEDQPAAVPALHEAKREVAR